MTTTPRRSRITAAIAAIAAAPLLLAACGSAVSTDTAEQQGTGRAVTIENCGRELTFEATPTRVASLMPTQTELLLRLGLDDAIVAQAQTSVSPLPDDLQRRPTTSPFSAPTPRRRAKTSSPPNQTSSSPRRPTSSPPSRDMPASTSSTTVALRPTLPPGCADRRNSAEVTDVFTDIENIGTIMDTPDAADELIKDGEIAGLRSRTALPGTPARLSRSSTSKATR